MGGELSKALAERIAAIEQRIHQNPELSFCEYGTTALIREELTRLGFSIVDLGLPTGVVARLATSKPGRTVGLRADIDAIRQFERVPRPDKSLAGGVMHACGHDVHTASLLGCAMLLSAHRELLKGDVVLIFQPGEEVLEGSRKLMDAGLLKRAPMDILFGLHNAPFLPIGTVGVKCGSLMSAKDDFELTVRGRGGHGGMPHLCVDPIVAASGIVAALQTIVSRNVNPLDGAVVSVCSIHGGTPENLIVDSVALTGSIRTLSTDTRETVLRRFREIVSSTAAAYGCAAEFELHQKALSVTNSPDMTLLGRKAAEAAVGAARIVEPEAVLASEDFSFYGAKLPTFFYFLGSGRPDEVNAPWHSDSFSAAKGASGIGARLYYESVLAAQGSSESFGG